MKPTNPSKRCRENNHRRAAHIPVEHSHIKLGTVNVQGKAAEYIQIIESARKRGVDFLADCYPYDAWHSI